jgi:hypothetical protein
MAEQGRQVIAKWIVLNDVFRDRHPEQKGLLEVR